jgi:hypothetical protein
MVSKTSPPSPEEIARQSVDRFVRRFGEPYRLLAYHAAFPLILTPELLNYLRNRFLHGQVPWVAEVDLLLSDLCARVGYEQYVMRPPVRAHLIEEMAQRLGRERVREVARLLINYIRYLSRTNPLVSSYALRSQQWAAMIYLEEQREKAVQEIAQSYEQSAGGAPMIGRAVVNTAAMASLSHLVKTLAPQLLDTYPELVGYAEHVSRYLEDAPGVGEEEQPEEASQEAIVVAGVKLPRIPQSTRVPAPGKARRFKIVRARQSIKGFLVEAEMQSPAVVGRITSASVRIRNLQLYPVAVRIDINPRKGFETRTNVFEATFSGLGWEERMQHFDLKPVSTGRGVIEIRVLFDSLLTMPGETKDMTHDIKHVLDRKLRRGEAADITLLLELQIEEPETLLNRRRVVGPREAAREADSLSQTLRLTVHEQIRGSASYFLYQVQSPELNLLETFSSLPFQHSGEDFNKAIYSRIEYAWLRSERDVGAFTRELRSLGAQLFDDLIPDKLQSLLWEHRQQFKNIFLVGPTHIPWELLHLKPPGKALPQETSFLGSMGLVRWHEGGGWPPQKIEINRRKIRHLTSPDLGVTRRKLWGMNDLPALEVDPRQVFKLLDDPEAFDLLHLTTYISTARKNFIASRPVLEIGDQPYTVLDAADIAHTQYSNFSRHRDHRPLVFVDAYKNQREEGTIGNTGIFAQAFLRGGAGAFIGNTWTLAGQRPGVFAREFYRQLMVNKLPLFEAVARARESARAEGDPMWLAYAVYGHPNLRIRLR